MARPAPLLLAYDGECSLCRRMVDWIQRRDRWGLVVTFPLQNAELLRMAPELAGRPLHREIHAVDTGNRSVVAGAAVFPRVLARLPRWRMLAPMLALPGVAPFARRAYLWVAARRYRLSGQGSPRR